MTKHEVTVQYSVSNSQRAIDILTNISLLLTYIIFIYSAL